MQGKLYEIDIRSILQLIELGQRTGELFVEAGSGQFWFVFFSNGQLVYAADTERSVTRLQDFLRRYRLENALEQIESDLNVASFSAPEYGYLWALLERRILTAAQGREIIQGMVQEVLFDLLSLHQGSFIFELGPSLAPQLTTLAIDPLVAEIMTKVQEWKKFHPLIHSPDQCPLLTEPEHLRALLPETVAATLERWAVGKASIRQLSRYLGRDILSVARAIYPYVQKGWIQMIYPPGVAAHHTPHDPWSQATERPPRVVCIDDGAAIRRTVEYILSRHGYEVTSIANPLKALSLVFALKPDLILCDIAMPELDGYELCAMLRRSAVFQRTPIIMLTGKDGFIDRVRARMVGATEYLTKPFGESELLTVVEKYVGVGHLEGRK
ncbi:DUF4388 domain-containing protein [Leptolyngbya sp. FACHB-261]|nr:DUF4388 domain-containing protein [Leptolyngbya sp. FACHB-261]